MILKSNKIAFEGGEEVALFALGLALLLAGGYRAGVERGEQQGAQTGAALALLSAKASANAATAEQEQQEQEQLPAGSFYTPRSYAPGEYFGGPGRLGSGCY